LFLYPFAFYTTSCKRKTFEFKSWNKIRL